MEQNKFYQIKSITADKYTLVGCDGSVITRPVQEVDKSASVFTIQNVKDGDVLACGDKITDCPFIFHNLTEELNPRSYCGVNTLCHFQDNDENGGSWCELNEVRPATKEQRDFLFQKMKEAGYEWDAEKKELKKIEHIDEYEGLTNFERTVADICIGWIGKELGWKEYIKDNADVLLKIAIKKFNKDFATVYDYEHANIQQKDFAPKATAANRQLYNRAILKILSNYVEKYPDIRFGQMLCNLDVNPHFDQESREAYWNLNEIINKSKDESKN